MTENKPEDVPAFPFNFINGFDGSQSVYKGMTLRDYFANAAMQGLLTHYDSRISLKRSADEHKISFGEEVAIQSYDMANEMLKARRP